MPPRTPEKKSQPARISPARRAAFQVLQAVQSGQGNSDTLLHSAFVDSLSQLDRNLATTLVMGVLRWQIALDATIAPLLSRPGEALPAPVATALRLGAFQLLHLDRIPAHAAISESVELCRVANNPQATGMVNAVLRKLTAPALGFAPMSPLLQLAVETAHPVWLLERWKKNYGIDTAATIARAGQQQPPLTVRRAIDDESPLPESWQPGAFLANNMRRETSAEIPEGCIAMDEGSQLVAEIAALPIFQTTSDRLEAASLSASFPAKTLDTCAAPGGKTLILAERNPNATITACDASPARLAALKLRLQHLPQINCLQADAADLPQSLTNFDRILCDAPCSGTGTLARNPEIRHRLQPGDLARQAERQRTLLRAALSRLARPSLLAPGGTLIYSTCSVEPEENENVLHAVLWSEKNIKLKDLQARDSKSGDFKSSDYQILDIRIALDALLAAGILLPAAHATLLETAVKENFLRTLPGIHPTDGFFAAILQRIN